MLQFIRSKAGSFFVKLLFVLLIGSFGIWGVGSSLRQAPLEPTYITVGSDTISGDRLRRGFRQVVDQLRQQTQGALDAEATRTLGIDQAVDGLVTDALFDQEAKRLHVAISDAQV